MKKQIVQTKTTGDLIKSTQYKKKKNPMGAKSKNGISFYTRTLLINNRPIKFIIDTGSPVTLIPKTKFNRITTIRPVSEDYRDVNDNKIKFEGKTLENIEIDGKSKQLELLITTKQTHPLLNLNWMKELGITLKTETPRQSINNINQQDQSNKDSDADIETLKSKFHKLFTENHRANNIEVDIQLKEGSKLIQQKGRHIPIHLKPAEEKEIEKLKKQGHIERVKNIDENCFESPAVITIKNYKSVDIGLDSRKPNEITNKRKAQVPIMKEFISRFPRKIADGPADEIWISKCDLDYAYGQLKLSRRAMDLCIFAVTGGNFTGYYQFLKGFYGLADILTIFQEQIDQTLENNYPAWLEDIIVVKKGSRQKHMNELIDVLSKLENA